MAGLFTKEDSSSLKYDPVRNIYMSYMKTGDPKQQIGAALGMMLGKALGVEAFQPNVSKRDYEKAWAASDLQQYGMPTNAQEMQAHAMRGMEAGLTDYAGNVLEKAMEESLEAPKYVQMTKGTRESIEGLLENVYGSGWFDDYEDLDISKEEAIEKVWQWRQEGLPIVEAVGKLDQAKAAYQGQQGTQAPPVNPQMFNINPN